MPEPITIRSYKGDYRVDFADRAVTSADFAGSGDAPVHVLIDARVAQLYAGPLADLLAQPTSIQIEATERNKAIDRIIPVIEQLVANGIKRDHVLLAIGGGIIQDITCFIASILMRGIEWRFVPTTLLAQADSCIGSKSSVNLGDAKNILGTFNPPTRIVIDPTFLDTLDPVDVRSGIGEIIKVHAIAGPATYDRLVGEFADLSRDRTVLARFMREALLIKQRFIEEDEFDKGIRNIFNYGHSFGHAIEAATEFGVPHGIAVTMGMAIANHVSAARGLTSRANRDRMGGILATNIGEFTHYPVPLDKMLTALTKDKKNTSTHLVVILPVGDEARIERVKVVGDDVFRGQVSEALVALAERAGAA